MKVACLFTAGLLLLGCGGNDKTLDEKYPSIGEFGAIFQDLDPGSQAIACDIQQDDEKLQKVLDATGPMSNGDPFVLDDVQMYLAVACQEP